MPRPPITEWFSIDINIECSLIISIKLFVSIGFNEKCVYRLTSPHPPIVNNFVFGLMLISKGGVGNWWA